MYADMQAQRRLTAATAERRPEVVHLHGTSLLSAPECLEYVKRFGPTSVEFIDEQSCRLMAAISRQFACCCLPVLCCAVCLTVKEGCSPGYQHHMLACCESVSVLGVVK